MVLPEHEGWAASGAEQATSRFSVEQETLSTGQRIRIHRGALAGMEGTVTANCDHSRLLVAVDCRQQGVSVEIDFSALEAID